MSDVELAVSDELEAWSVTEFGLVDFRAIGVFLSSVLVSGDWRAYVGLSDGIQTTW
jgi:D-lyxose ketol-isomerase